ncbi:MAG TPA: hypothetical protein VE267_12765 [Bradyrhizobium sp.]|nr:hypothetical protein [Bradyrhizobium sp.]
MTDWRLPEAERLDWWPSHVRRAFANLGQILGPQQINPQILDRVSSEGLPGHQIIFGHLSGKELGARKGMYTLEITGPIYAGQWRFPSGLLENLARAAARI